LRGRIDEIVSRTRQEEPLQIALSVSTRSDALDSLSGFDRQGTQVNVEVRTINVGLASMVEWVIQKFDHDPN
jgi:hypothetical protein